MEIKSSNFGGYGIRKNSNFIKPNKLIHEIQPQFHFHIPISIVPNRPLCFPCRRHLYLLCPYPSPPCTPCANTLPSSIILSRFGGDYLRGRLHPFPPVLSQHDWLSSKNGTGPTGATVESSLLSSSAMGTVCVRSSLTWANNCLRFVQRVLAVASLVYSKSCHIWLWTHRDLTRSSIAQFSFPSFAISSSFAFSLFIIPILIAVDESREKRLLQETSRSHNSCESKH